MWLPNVQECDARKDEIRFKSWLHKTSEFPFAFSFQPLALSPLFGFDFSLLTYFKTSVFPFDDLSGEAVSFYMSGF